MSVHFEGLLGVCLGASEVAHVEREALHFLFVLSFGVIAGGRHERALIDRALLRAEVVQMVKILLQKVQKHMQPFDRSQPRNPRI